MDGATNLLMLPTQMYIHKRVYSYLLNYEGFRYSLLTNCPFVKLGNIPLSSTTDGAIDENFARYG